MMLHEIRRTDGTLFAFEVGSGYTSYRALCRFLARYPGIEFVVRPQAIVGAQPARFVFKGKEFEVCIPFSGYWVGPADTRETFPETEELLTHVRSNLIAPWKRRLVDVLCLDFKSAMSR